MDEYDAPFRMYTFAGADTGQGLESADWRLSRGDFRGAVGDSLWVGWLQWIVSPVGVDAALWWTTHVQERSRFDLEERVRWVAGRRLSPAVTELFLAESGCRTNGDVDARLPRWLAEWRPRLATAMGLGYDDDGVITDGLDRREAERLAAEAVSKLLATAKAGAR